MSDDEYSDLTDIDSDEEDDYRITNALSVARSATYTTQALFDQIHNNDINLEPEYQRDVVWTEAKQIGLIDSIFRNFYVPPVIFTVQIDDEGAETRTCIDGKQRLTSIHKFMDGLIPHRDQLTGKRYWYKDTQTTSGARKKKLLPSRLRKLFSRKQIVCVEYQNLSEAAEREIFQRVQLGMALTPAEKLQVVKTFRSDFIRELQNIYMKEDGSLANGALQWDTTRGGDYRGIAQAVFCMDRINSGFKNVGMPQLEKWLNIDQRLERSFVHQVRDSFRIFAALARDPAHQKVFKEPVKTSPVEFTLFAVFIYAHKDKSTLAQLASGIAKMRVDVRNAHVDIRTNSKVMKTMSEFITKWKPTKLPGDTGSIIGVLPGANSKRKRSDKDGDDYMDSDEDVDEDDADVYREEQARKAARKSVNAVASSSSTAPPSKRNGTMPKTKIKAEPTTSPPNIPPPPPTDRLAALRRAKETAMQNQTQRIALLQSSQMPPPNQNNSELAPAPQLPSPGQPFSFPSNYPNASNNLPPPTVGPSSSQGRLPLPSAISRLPPPPPLSSGNSIDTTLMATMMQHRINPPVLPSRPGASHLPPPPMSGSNTSSVGENDRDRDAPSRKNSLQMPEKRTR